jgi:citrate synthase
MNKKATISFEGKDYEFDVLVGTENEHAIDARALRNRTGLIAYDPGFGNTAACKSDISFIDGDQGILRHRGYSIEELAENSSFTEVSYLLLNGELPTRNKLDEFEHLLTYHTLLHEDMKKFFEGFPPNAHPMTVLSTMVTALAAYYPKTDYTEDRTNNMIRLLAKVPTIAALSYKKSIGHPFVYPDNNLDYVSRFLKMMFGLPTEEYTVNEKVRSALDKLLILHADHEQNASASTVRMVGSTEANLFHSISAGIHALSGPLHGAANQMVIEMLETILNDGGDSDKYIKMAKSKENKFRLMGFGHRVYRNFDPRANILKKAADSILKELKVEDPLLEIAKNLEVTALEDEYFIDRKLYPNVDFYSGIIYRALKIPTSMFTVMFAMGRLPGWISQWKESTFDPDFRIHRPRQIYTGNTQRPYKPINER